jgi:hypothetical protein
MKKTFIPLILFLMMVGVVTALDFCNDPQAPNQSCKLVTPAITCTVYNYSIINSSGQIINSSTLQLFNNSVYWLNFTEPRGDYLILLCDGSTRSIRVGEGSDMLIALIIAIIIIPFLLLFFASILERYDIGENGEKIPNNWNYILRFIAFMFFISFIPLIANLCMKMTEATKYFHTAQMVYRISFGFVVVFFLFIFLYLFFKGFKMIPFYKEEKD